MNGAAGGLEALHVGSGDLLQVVQEALGSADDGYVGRPEGRREQGAAKHRWRARQQEERAASGPAETAEEAVGEGAEHGAT